MRLLLIALTCLVASSALPEERQKRGILPGDARYGLNNHHHQPETVVETAKSIGGYAYSIPDSSIYTPQNVYGPPGYQPGLPINNDYLSPVVDVKYAAPIAVQQSVRIPQITKTVGSLPLENIRTITALPPATSYGTPLFEPTKTLKTFKTAPISQVTGPAVTTLTKNVYGSAVYGERIQPTLEGIQLQGQQFTSYAPSAYANLQPVKSVHVEAPVNTVQFTKTVPTAYGLPQSIELPRTIHTPQPFTKVVERFQPFTAVKSVETVAPLQPIQSVHTVKTVEPLPQVQPIQSIHTVKTLTQVQQPIHTVRTLQTLPSLPTVHPVQTVQTLKTVAPLPPAHHVHTVKSYDTVTSAPLPLPGRTYEAVAAAPLPLPVKTYEAVAAAPLPVKTYEAVTAAPLPVKTYETVTAAPLPLPVKTYESVTTATPLPLPVKTYESVTAAPLPLRVKTYETVTAAPLPSPVKTYESVTAAPLPLPVKTYEAVTPLPHAVRPLPAVRTYEPVHSLPAVRTYEHPLPAVRTYEHPLPAVRTYEPVHPLPALKTYEYSRPAVKTFESVHTLPAVKTLETVTPIPQVHRLSTLRTVETFPTVEPVHHAEPVHHLETLHHPTQSVEIVHPTVETEHIQTVAEVKTPLIHKHVQYQRGPITDFLGSLGDKFPLPSLPSLPQLPSLPSLPSIPGFPFQPSTVAPVEISSPVPDIHIPNGVSKDSITVENPLLPSNNIVHTGFDHHVTPAHDYIQPTDANGGYIY